MSDGGKGSAPRPFIVDRDTFASNWDRTFSGSGVMGSAADSNSAGSGSAPDSPAKYHDAGIAAMDAYTNASIEAGRIPTRHGCLDAAVRGVAVAFVRDKARQVVSDLLDHYIDDATGA